MSAKNEHPITITAELTYDEAYAFAKVIRRIDPENVITRPNDIDTKAYYRALDKLSTQLPETFFSATLDRQ
jgi:hypothetical protein